MEWLRVYRDDVLVNISARRASEQKLDATSQLHCPALAGSCLCISDWDLWAELDEEDRWRMAMGV